ncbi:MAG: tRNA (N(6)-L-threonylcarbamoyladenosine(37)-C(2))-methylthiotransferase MtaB [Anaerolineae bacterium]|nr:tRNA (N(6)-L-threonylcarbamoyladenosine(37)-C(2))-methylthiotransferase MtaB [Anaerolineae bacterium]
MKVFLETLGCRLNYSEMEALGRQLAAAGHQVVGTPEQADVCVLNTCAVTAEAARKSRQTARRLARANPSARLAITGCYATLAPAEVGGLPNVRLVVENRRKEQLAELLEPWSAELDGEQWRRLAPEAPPQAPTRTRAFVKVQDGCNNRCTFCIVTVARGEERSRPIADIVAEIRRLEAEGYQEAVLTGVHLGGYGRDLGASLHQLVAALLEGTSLPRLRLSSLEPWDLSPPFFDLWPQSGGRLCPHLHLPAQSGSDAVLRRMARRNRSDDFRRLAAEARARIPDLVLTTDIIVGFPGETTADLDATLEFIREMRFAHVHVFPYSPRAGTAAARFPDQVPVEERRRRVDAVETVAAATGEEVRRAFLGQVRPVLWEQVEPANGAGPVWQGLTDNYLRVHTTAPPHLDLANRITPARLLALEAGSIRAELRAE